MIFSILEYVIVLQPDVHLCYEFFEWDARA